MIDLKKLQENCTGCGACTYLCPTKSIVLKPDREGFLSVEIEQNTCIECGICTRSCHQNVNYKNESQQLALAALSKNKIRRRNSSSGGVFAELAQAVIDSGGAVAGTVYDQNLNVVQILTLDAEDISRMQGSKYVQAASHLVYADIKKKLESRNKTVLYAGTPCQVAGLYSFLKCRPENLYTIDLICHGVPSPDLFKRYISWKESRLHNKISGYSFRNKSPFDRTGFHAKIYLTGKKKSVEAERDPFYADFLECRNFRECCYQCKYSATERVGDITIGDLDKADCVAPGFFGWEALSCVIINNCHGRELWDKVSESFYIAKISLEEEAKYNHNLQMASSRPPCRSEYYKSVNHDFFDKREASVYRKTGILRKLKRFIPVRVKYWLKQRGV